MDLDNILGSIVISGIITTVFTFINTRHSSKLSYITNERKQWREEIRKLAEEIYGSTQFTIGKITTKLKVRINAYGLINDIDYEKDSHIWKIIDSIEHAKSNEEFNKYRTILIKLLSLLLKDDWEKAKYEVKGNLYSALEIVLLFSSIGSLLFIYLNIFKLSIRPHFISSIFMIIVLISSCYKYKSSILEKIKKHGLMFNAKNETMLFFIKALLIMTIVILLFISEFNEITIDVNVFVSALITVLLLFLGWFLTLNNLVVRNLYNYNTYYKGICVIVEHNNNKPIIKEEIKDMFCPLCKNELHIKKRHLRKGYLCKCSKCNHSYIIKCI